MNNLFKTNRGREHTENVGHHEQNETTLWIIVIDEGQKFQVNRLEHIFNKSIEENFPNGAKATSRQD